MWKSPYSTNMCIYTYWYCMWKSPHIHQASSAGALPDPALPQWRSWAWSMWKGKLGFVGGYVMVRLVSMTPTPELRSPPAMSCPSPSHMTVDVQDQEVSTSPPVHFFRQGRKINGQRSNPGNNLHVVSQHVYTLLSNSARFWTRKSSWTCNLCVFKCFFFTLLHIHTGHIILKTFVFRHPVH